MGAVIDLLEQNGLVRDEDVLRVAEFPKKKIGRLHQQLYATVLEEQGKAHSFLNRTGEIDPFSFVASRSLRGEGCGEMLCRLKKFDFLGRYAALYADRVILPLPLQDPLHVKDPGEAREQIFDASLALLHLRPLVDVGLIFPVTMRSFHHCEHEVKWVDKMIKVIHKVAYEIAGDLKGDFRVRYQLPEKSPTGLSCVYIEGPEDFLEHGSLVVTFDESEGWRSRSWRYDRGGMVELRGNRKLDFLKDIFKGIADDTTFYLTYGRDSNARFLSSQKGESLLLDLITEQDEELSATSDAMKSYLAHTLPLLGDIPLGKLLHIRKQERDSFARYRDAIGALLRDVTKRKKRVGKHEMQGIFRERIEPQLLKIKSELGQERKRQIRRIAGGAGALAASVALGAIGQVIPSLAAGAVGTGLLTEAAKSKCNHEATLQEQNDFYFLLRLSQEAEGSN